MKTYQSQEELKQLKVLTMVLQKKDFKRLGDIALSVLQINPSNPIATMLYNLDLHWEAVVQDIYLYSFNTVAVDDYLEEFVKSEVMDDKESLTINLQTLFSLIELLAYSTYGTESTLNLIFECFKKLEPNKEAKTKFYKIVVENFCDKRSLSALCSEVDVSDNIHTYFSSSDVLKTRQLCLVSLKKRISGDSEIDDFTKKSLTEKIDSTKLTTTLNAEQNISSQNVGVKLNKWMYIGLGIAAVVAFVIFYISCF